MAAKSPKLTNPVLEAMRAGRAALGLSVRLSRSPEVVRIAKATGHQFLFIDGQHAVFNVETIVNLASTALALGVAPMVRVRSPVDADVPMLLDNGVSGIIFPDVNTAEEARRCVEVCKFAPVGRRSVGAVFPQFNGETVPMADAIREINASTVVCVMVETKRGLENVEEIAKVPGVDGVHVGTNDLMVDLGKPGRLDDPAVDAALDRTIAACKAAGNYAGCGGIRDVTRQADVIRRGARFLTTQSDTGFLLAAAKAWTDGVNARLS
jgi:staphyloferrin B biosynthesis citrate synthase